MRPWPLSEPGPERRSVIVRHWRGELSLARSYWVNGLLVNVLLRVVVAAASLWLSDVGYEPVIILASLVGFAALALAATVWQVVGIWRAAERSVTLKRGVGWARAAQVMCVIGPLLGAPAFARDVLQPIAEFVPLALGRDPLGTFAVRVLRDGTELELAGPLVYGAARAVERALEQHPGIRVIHLDSDGGRMGEGRTLAQVIERRGLTTYTAARCLSACTIAFAAGAERLMLATARFGFHHPAFGTGDTEGTLADVQSDIAYFGARGIDTGFAVRGLTEPNDAMWFPPPAELLRARFVTAVVPQGRFGVSGVRLEDLARLEAETRALPLFAVLEELEPALFEDYIAALRNAVIFGQSIMDVRAAFMPRFAAVTDRDLPRASDAALIAAMELTLSQAVLVQGHSAARCYEYFNESWSAALLDMLAPTRSRELEVMGEVIRSARTAPARIPARAEVERLLQQVTMRLGRRFGAARLDYLDPAHGRGNPAAYCDITVAFFQEVMRLPRAQALPVLRFLFAQAAGGG